MLSVCCLIKSIEHDSMHSYFESNKKTYKSEFSMFCNQFKHVLARVYNESPSFHSPILVVPLYTCCPALYLQSRSILLVPLYTCSPALYLQSRPILVVPSYTCSPALYLLSRSILVVPLYTCSPALYLQSRLILVVPLYTCSPALYLQSRSILVVPPYTCSPALYLQSRLILDFEGNTIVGLQYRITKYSFQMCAIKVSYL